MAIVFVCELATPKIRKELNKKGLRYDFLTLMATVTFVWPLRARAMKQNHCSFLLATYSQNLEGIEQATAEI